MQAHEEERLERIGTRFLLYPQPPHVSGYGRPEPVWISTSPGNIRPGPQDSRAYIADPIAPKAPYEFPDLPPYRGPLQAPVEPGPDGHFDHLEPGTRAFVTAHAFAGVRRVLDIWESYLAGPLTWHFQPEIERLEIVPLIDWENAQSGFGFLELGVYRTDDGGFAPFALNMDVIAHEVGHAILFAIFDAPRGGANVLDFGAYHESAADLISLLTLLHFDNAVERLLRATRGNLLTLNELNRIAELSAERQIRMASNSRRMSETSDEIHDRSRPFTGAVFDVLVETYHRELVRHDLIDERLLDLDPMWLDATDLEWIDRHLALSFARQPFGFKAALAVARDAVGRTLCHSWDWIQPEAVTFRAAALAMTDVAAETGDDGFARNVEENFVWREIL